MKKILFILALLFSEIIFSQPLNNVSTMNHSGNTLENTGIDTLYSSVSGGFGSISVQIKYTKVSGTIAGYAILQASLDNANWQDIGVDSLKPTDVTTNTKIWVVENSPYKNYRIYCKGSGTMSAHIYGYILPNSPTNFTSGVKRMTTAYGTYVDSVANTATNTVLIRVQAGYKTTAIQVVIHKISGTPAGTVTLQGSNDGINFVTTNTGYLSNDVTAAPFTTGGGATMTMTNVNDKNKIFSIRGTPYEYYRLSYTGSGTMLCTLRGYVLAQ